MYKNLQKRATDFIEHNPIFSNHEINYCQKIKLLNVFHAILLSNSSVLSWDSHVQVEMTFPSSFPS